MERKIKSLACQVQSLKMMGFDADPRIWLQNQPCVGENSWFLAHADDGMGSWLHLIARFLRYHRLLDQSLCIRLVSLGTTQRFEFGETAINSRHAV
jgi:hypothetical protein